MALAGIGWDVRRPVLLWWRPHGAYKCWLAALAFRASHKLLREILHHRNQLRVGWSL